jgi:hypothetical protein
MDKGAIKKRSKKIYKNTVQAVLAEHNRDAIQYYLYNAKDSNVLEIEEATNLHL